MLEIELGRIPFFGVGQNSTLMKCFISFSDALTDEDFEQKDAPKLASTESKNPAYHAKAQFLAKKSKDNSSSSFSDVRI